ncbi:geranylgeranyl pyrophosphate synthetase [Xanthoria calcicola]
MPETSSKNSAKDTQVYHTPSPLADGSPKRENEHHINRDHFQDGSSSIGIGHLMTGDDPQGGSSAVSEANRKEGGRPRPVNGPRESDQSGDTYEEPGTEILLAPYEYVAAMPTENVCEVFIDGLNSWLQLPEKSLNCIRSMVVKLYTAALMLEDVEGASILRRGMPSAHVVYGASQTIISAGYVQICVFAEAAGLSNPGAVSIVCEELTNLYTGHSMDLFWKFHSHCPTEEEYYEMVDGKTGGFFRLILRLMQAESPVLKYDFTSPLPSAPLGIIPARAFEPALKTFTTSLGRYFQVRNEYENLASSKDVHREGFYENLDEGKMSLPVIHSLQNSSGGDKARIKGMFKTRGPSGLSPEVK